MFFDSIFRLVFTRLISTRINFDLFQHCLFYALTLQLFISLTLLLVINKHLCLCKVCFMLVLAILRLSDVFSSVLGVVYRLGLKQCVRRLNFGLFVMSYEKKRKAYARHTTYMRRYFTRWELVVDSL